MSPLFSFLTPAVIHRWQRRLAPVLIPLGKAYAQGMRWRAKLHARKKTTPLGVPCISIGNLAAGGTGKTPLAAWFLAWAARNSRHAAVLTRGYGSRAPEHPWKVPLDASPLQAGDEPLMLAQSYPQASVIIDPVRRRGAAHAIACHHPDLLLLDDGFQHLAVHRDVNIVLLRPEDIERDWDRVLPSGIWREDHTALHRADLVLIRASEKLFLSMQACIAARLRFLSVPVFSFSLQPNGLWKVRGNIREKIDGSPLLGRPYILVSAVGSPAEVQKSAAALMRRPPDEQLLFADHHVFTRQDAQRIKARASHKKLAVLTTAKDAAKLARIAGFPFFMFQAEAVFGRWGMKKSGDAYSIVPVSFPDWWQREARRLGLLAPSSP